MIIPVYKSRIFKISRFHLSNPQSFMHGESKNCSRTKNRPTDSSNEINSVKWPICRKGRLEEIFFVFL